MRLVVAYSLRFSLLGFLAECAGRNACNRKEKQLPHFHPRQSTSNYTAVGEITKTDTLAHIFWEMTWAGYDDEAIKQRINEIRDAVDELT